MCGGLTLRTRAWLQDGATPIFVAAQNGHKGCIELLARLGGDVSTCGFGRHSGCTHMVVWQGGVRTMLVGAYGLVFTSSCCAHV